jgi:hypothetical protein
MNNCRKHWSGQELETMSSGHLPRLLGPLAALVVLAALSGCADYDGGFGGPGLGYGYGSSYYASPFGYAPGGFGLGEGGWGGGWGGGFGWGGGDDDD